MVIMIFGTILVIGAICGKHWIQTMDSYSGLWEVCDLKSKDCKELDNRKFYTYAVRTGVRLSRGVSV